MQETKNMKQLCDEQRQEIESLKLERTRMQDVHADNDRMR